MKNKTYFRNIATGGLLFLLATASFVCADEDSFEIRPVDQEMWSSCPSSCERACVSSGCAPIDPCDGLRVYAGWLYWKTKPEGYTAGVELTDFVESQNFSSIGIKKKTLDFGWNSGFRLGFDYGLCCDRWVIGAEWSHMHANASKNSFSPFSTNVYSPYGEEIELEKGSKLTAEVGISYEVKSKINLNLLNLKLSRALTPGCRLQLAPHVGLQFVSADMQTSSKFVGQEEGIQFIEDVRTRNKFTGGGVRAGIDTDWCLGCNLSIYGEGSLALVYGRFKTDVTFDDEEKDPSVVIPSGQLADIRRTTLDDNPRATRMGANLGLGFRWTKDFNCGGCSSQLLSVKLGWEQQHFFRFVRAHRLSGANLYGLLGNQEIKSSEFPILRAETVGDLTFQGINLTLQLDF